MSIKDEIEQAVEVTEKGAVSGEELDNQVQKETQKLEEERQEGDEAQEEVKDNEQAAEEESEENIKGSKDTVKVEFSPKLLARAVQSGLRLDELDAFKDENSLESVILEIENNQRIIQDLEKSRIQEGEEEETDELEDFPELDPEVYEEEVIKMFGQVKEIIQKQNEQIRQLRNEQRESVSSSRAAVERELEQWFDGKIAGLGEEFQDTLGVGGYSSLPQGSAHLANREAIANQMGVMMAGYNAMGIAPPSRDRVFSDAAKVVLGNEFHKSTEKKLSKKLSERSKMHINRAGGSKGQIKKNTEQEIAEMLDAKFGKR